MRLTTHRTFIGTLPRRANRRGGTSHSDPIPANAQALRPSARLKSLPDACKRGIHEISDSAAHGRPCCMGPHSLIDTLSLSSSFPPPPGVILCVVVWRPWGIFVIPGFIVVWSGFSGIKGLFVGKVVVGFVTGVFSGISFRASGAVVDRLSTGFGSVEA